MDRSRTVSHKDRRCGIWDRGQRNKSAKGGKGCRFSVSPLAVLPFLCCALLSRGPLFPCACLAALLHELGHLAAIFLCGGRVEKFALYPFGAEIVTGGRMLSYGQSLLVAVAGIGVNGLCVLPLLWRDAPYVLQVFSCCSLGLALFNLLPLERLDGGEVVKNLALLILGPERAGGWCRFFSLLGAVGLFGFLLCGVFFARLNPLFLLLFLYLLWGVL